MITGTVQGKGCCPRKFPIQLGWLPWTLYAGCMHRVGVTTYLGCDCVRVEELSRSCEKCILHAIIPDKDKIFIKPPNVEVFRYLKKIMWLIKFLYCIRQGPEICYQYFSKEVVKLGFRRSSVFDCLVIRSEPTYEFIFVNVDDVIIIGTKLEIAWVKSQLDEIVTGPCSYLLGVLIVRKHGGVFLSQQAYNERLIRKQEYVTASLQSHQPNCTVRSTEGGNSSRKKHVRLCATIHIVLYSVGYPILRRTHVRINQQRRLDWGSFKTTLSHNNGKRYRTLSDTETVDPTRNFLTRWKKYASMFWRIVLLGFGAWWTPTTVPRRIFINR